MGRIFQLAARTHEREVRANSFDGVPKFNRADRIMSVHISSVADLRALLGIGNIIYLAYFGHSLNEGAGALLIGQENAPDTNLTNAPGANNTPVSSLPAADLRVDGHIRLFGCRGAYGVNSIAEQLAAHFRVPVFGYSNDGGSIGTTNRGLGHGKRPVRRADVDRTIQGSPHDVWLVPADGKPTFRRF